MIREQNGKSVIIDNIIDNFNINMHDVTDMINILEDNELSKSVSDDYIFTDDYDKVITVIGNKYPNDKVNAFLMGIRNENRITRLSYGDKIFDKLFK